MSFKLWAVLGLVIALVGSVAWHKQVVRDRDDAKAQVAVLTASVNAYKSALKKSEELRRVESEAAKQALLNSRKDADRRVAEARRSAGAIKKIVEKPHAIDPKGCPVPDVVSTDELRDALQPAPFGAAPAPEPGGLSAPEARAPASWDHSASERGGPSDGPAGNGGLPELGVGRAGVGQGAGPWSAGASQLPGV